MTNAVIITTPNEVERFLQKRLCPICRGQLNKAIDTISFCDGSYQSDAYCDSADHYTITLNFNDPKDLKVASEFAQFYDGDIKYSLTFNYHPEDPTTTLNVVNLETDDVGSNITFKGQLFKLKKFDRVQILNDLKFWALMAN